jgi:hypothetical protein
MSSDVANDTGTLPEGVTPTSVTVQILKLATEAGLNPTVRKPYRGVIEVHLNGPTCDSAFGVIRIGTRSGRVLRAILRHGNDGDAQQYGGAVAVRAALRALASG